MVHEFVSKMFCYISKIVLYEVWVKKKNTGKEEESEKFPKLNKHEGGTCPLVMTKKSDYKAWRVL